MPSDKDIEVAAKVVKFMERCRHIDAPRFNKATSKCIPFGDLAYGQALVHWRAHGKPATAFFSYAEGQMECPLLMAFRKEIGDEFGLPILTQEEAKVREKTTKTLIHKVMDWGIN